MLIFSRPAYNAEVLFFNFRLCCFRRTSFKEFSVGLKWRKSMSMGPVRANMSSSGVGWSINLGLCRLGLNAQGKCYFSAGIPGTGLYYTTNINDARKPPQ